MQRHLRKQSKVILVTKDKGKCVFPARRTMPRKEASANPGCPMVYHKKTKLEAAASSRAEESATCTYTSFYIHTFIS